MITEAGTKVCTKCGLEKSLSEYQKNKARRDGVETYCRHCNNARHREKYANDPEYRASKSGTSHKSDSKEYTECSIDECTDSGTLKGLCRTHYMRDWHALNRDKRMDTYRERLSTDPDFHAYRLEVQARSERKRRAIKSDVAVSHITKTQYDELFEQYDKTCWICGCSLVDVTFHWDHYHPLSKGGAHSVENLRPACSTCNTRKNAAWPFTDSMKNALAEEVRALRTSQETGSLAE